MIMSVLCSICIIVIMVIIKGIYKSLNHSFDMYNLNFVQYHHHECPFLSMASVGYARGESLTFSTL